MNLKPSVIHLLDHGVLTEKQKKALDEREAKNQATYERAKRRGKKPVRVVSSGRPGK